MLFSHRHCWRILPPLGPIEIKNAAGKIEGVTVVQQCSCGTVRQVEVKQGEAPVIRFGRYVARGDD